MRFLNKVVFIQSADIKYEEIMLNGNVHFIGDQGAGKSTILRAILFFYNADTQRLGIPISKKEFAEHYFKYSNSYIIYEVISGQSQFLVWLYKEHGKLCYRFIHSSFKREFFIEQSSKGGIPLTPDKVLENVRRETQGSSKINTFKEYRDIIYGAFKTSDKTAKQWSLFALLENSAYQNIPKTISSIFLNSQLYSDAIKTTIISSISEDDQVNQGKGYTIDLNVLRKQLSDFQQDYDDITDFERIKNRSKDIISTYDKILIAEHNKIITAQRLGASWWYTEARLGELGGIIQVNETEKQRIDVKIRTERQYYQAEEKKLNDVIAVQRGNIKKAKEKITYYQSIHIEEILHRVQQEGPLIIELESYKSQLKVLLMEFDSIEQKYQTLLTQLETKRNRLVNSIQETINSSKKNHIEQVQAINIFYQELFEQIDERNEQQKDEVDGKRRSNEKLWQGLQKLSYDISNTRYFEQEIEIAKQELQTLHQNTLKKELGIREKELLIEKWQREAEHERERLQNAFESDQKEIHHQQQDIQKQIQAINNIFAN
jgi:hypothetical protein